MSLLTDTDLGSRLCSEEKRTNKNTLNIYPLGQNCLTPVGYDLRVGNQYASVLKSNGFSINEGDKIVIGPGDTVLITTREKVEMPADRSLSALIMSKVSQVSRGLSHISTTIDADWEGYLLIAVHNYSRSDVSLNFEDPFCTVVFFENKSPSTRNCDRQSNRPDVFMNNLKVKNLIEAAKKAHKQDILKIFAPIVTIIITGGAGYWIFGNSSGFVAMTAIGVGIAGIVGSLIRKCL